jgi:hypothetical protein
MTGSKLTWAAAGLLVLVALAGVGLGRWTAAEAGDKKRLPADEPVIAAEGKPGPAKPFEERKPVGKAKEFVVTRPTGTWVREVPGFGRTTLRFEEDRLYATGELAVDGGRLTLSVEADYAINKESMVFGVITGVECDDAEEGLELEMMLTGQPFAFRYRADGDTLTVKDPKGVGYGLEGADEPDEVVLLVAGRYVAADENRAAPAPRAPVKPAPRNKTGTGRKPFQRQDAPSHMTPEQIHGGIR